MTDVVGLGEAMVLLEPAGGGPLSTAPALVPRVAGAELNLCATVARCGLTAAFCSRVGDDPWGDTVLAAAGRLGVHAGLVEREPGSRTGVFFREALPDGLRRVYYYRAGSAASHMDAGDGERALAPRPRALVVSGVTLALGAGPVEAVLAAVRQAVRLGTKLVVDPNLRPQLGGLAAVAEPLRTVIASADLLLAGLDEARALFGEHDPTALVAAAHAVGSREVVLKDGDRGCWYEEAGQAVHLPAIPVRAVDPVGAGDAFGGGYLATRLRGGAARQAATVGARLGALVAASPGDTEGLPATADARELLRSAVEGGDDGWCSA